MGMMGMFKWLRKDVQRDRNGWNLAQKQCGLNNESYRNALQAFIDRRRTSDDIEIEAPSSPDKKRSDFLVKTNNNKCDNERKSQESKSTIPGVPHIPASEIFEIGWVAGTEDRYLELIFAEWQNTRVSLKRHSHPECKDAVKADLDVLSEIRHPNVLLLMASTITDDHGLVSIIESVDCTLYHYIHDQGERISIQGIAKCGGRLSDALRHSHMRGYVHTAVNSHCVYLASSGIVKLGGWELAMQINGMQYEDEEPVYVDQYVNNNNETGKTYNLPMKSPMALSKSKGSKLTKSISAKQLSYSVKNSDSPPRQYLFANKSMAKQNANQKPTAHIEQINIFAENITGNTKENTQNMGIFNSVQNNYKKINYPTCNIGASDIIQSQEPKAEEILQPWNSTYRKVRAPQEAESRTASVYSSPLLESTDDESFKDARTNLKQLKKVLANKREHFFYGSDSSYTSTSLSKTNKNKILIEAKSKDYEPHKPASHKISLEPKCNKSPNQYDPSYLKSTFQQYRKIPYLHTPDSIKGAVMQPQVLNPDPQSFFETSLWRKEKLICLSKMRKACANESTGDNDTVSTEAVAKNQTTESISTNSNNTYIVRRQPEETNREEFTQVSENTNDQTIPTTPQSSRSLQVLKDALDRATKIVRSVTPNTDESCLSTPFKSYQDFEVTTDDNQIERSIFEDLYDLKINNDSEEIKTIERSTTRNKMFLFGEPNKDNTTNTEAQKDSDTTISATSFERSSRSYDTTSGRNFVCESIAEVSGEFNASCNNAKSPERTTELSSDQRDIDISNKVSKPTQKSEMTIAQNKVKAEIQTEEEEQKSAVANFNLMLLNDATKNKNCKACHQSVLPRRRSLPAALSQLRVINSPVLAKLPIRRGDIPDNTVEDLYIDDEFGDSLNINMVLLNEDLSVDEDFLSEISDL
ncbi:unnamed protein product [Xylocopa violacea]|uniref:Serine-threonine/tyrosine-protein kinase catalytic domain-containing protein n=1 Tax=Xylocopa violacea TaxID=135666 RepID=A0ABP1PDS9_XYLVO